MYKVSIPIKYNYVSEFIPKYDLGSNKEYYVYACFIMFTKVHEITYIPYKSSEFFKFFKGYGLSRPTLQNFYNIIVKYSSHYINYIKDNQPVIVFNNWKFILNDLNLWFTNGMKKFKLFLESYKENKTIKFREFYQRFIQTLLLVFFVSEQKRVDRNLKKKEKIFKILKRKQSNGQFYIPNHIHRSNYRLLSSYNRQAREQGKTLLSFLIREEGRLIDQVRITASFLSNKFGLSQRIISSYLSLMEKNGLIRRNKVLKEIFETDNELMRRIGLETHGYYNFRMNNKFYKCVYSEIKLNAEYQPSSWIYPGQKTIESSVKLKDIKIKKKYKFLKNVK